MRSLISRLLMLVLAVVMASGLCLAQSMGKDNGPKANGAQTGNFRDPNNVMKMRQMTMKQRRAAATRNAERRAKHQQQKGNAMTGVKS